MRDPVHGWINVDKDLIGIIDNPLFQRLGFVRQLTSAQYAFPGARHTRKEHCLGAMHLVGRYLDHFQHSKIKLKPELTKCIKISALLHDISHGPFSHSFDSTVYYKIYDVHKGHDEHRHVLLDYFDLSSKEKEIITNIWRGNVKWVSGIVQGVVGVDRLDFSKRDSFYTGTSYGCFDIDGIIDASGLEMIDGGIKLFYDAKIVKRIIQGLTTRLYMYEEIYLNKTVIAASIIIEAMMLEAAKHIDYVDRSLDIGKFVYLNDSSVFSEILFSVGPELEKAREYAQQLYLRKLPKLISSRKIIGENHKVGITILEDDKIKWTSRTLSKNFIKEFEKSDIYIRDGKKFLTFRDYCQNNKIELPNESYYFERIYQN